MKVAVSTIALLVMSSALVAPAQAPDQQPKEQSGTIRGVVFTADGKKPVSQALVSLAESHRLATTDEKGEFKFTDVPFGREVAAVKKDGYLCSARNGPLPTCVKSFEVYTPDTRVELSMLPEAIVAGRVVNQEGTPIRNLALLLLEKEISKEGLYTWRGLGATNVRTDANGAFRISKLEPGSYLLLAPTAVDPPGDFPPPHPDHGYSSTYYPGVLDQKEAQPLAIHAGNEIKADLIIRRQRLQPITLNYRWEFQAEPQPGQFGTCESAPAGSRLLVGGPVEHSHSLRFLAPPGDYKLCFALESPTATQTGAPRPYYGSATFTVRDQPVTIDNIPVQQSTNVSFHINVQLTKSKAQAGVSSQPQPVSRAVVSFELWGEDGEYNYTSWSTDNPAPTSEFKNVPPGRYVLRAFGNSSAYVASLTCGLLNLLREPLVIGLGVPACTIEAVIRDDLASLSIGLTPQAKAQMAVYGTTVTDFALIPSDNSLELPFSGGIWTSESKKVQIPPGSYIAFLFDGRNPAWSEPEFQEQLKRQGSPVTLAPGDDKTLLLDFKPEFDSPNSGPVGVAFGRVLP
jgi:hypothetical protein